MEIMLKWLFQIAAALPLPVLHGLGNALGWVMYGVLGEDRRRIRRHLRQAGLPHGWRDVLRVCQETVKSGLELPVAFFRQPEKIGFVPRGTRLAAYSGCLKCGRGLAVDYAAYRQL